VGSCGDGAHWRPCRKIFRRPARRAVLFGTTALVALHLSGPPADAADATWISTGDVFWNTDANWSSGVTPASPDQATFGAGTLAFVAITAPASIGSIMFAPGADSHFFDVTQAFTVTGGGIQNNSANVQTFSVNGGASLNFTGGTTGGAVEILNFGAVSYANASAGGANISNGGSIDFNAGSTGGTATIANNSIPAPRSTSTTAARAAPPRSSTPVS
jgi:hypothetical protein